MTIPVLVVPKALAGLLGESLAAMLVALTSSASDDPVAVAADAFGIDLEAAKDRLAADDLHFRELADLSLLRGKDELLFDDETAPRVSDAVKALADGRVVFEAVAPASAPIMDVGTEGWLDVVEAAAESGRCHVLYRVGNSEPEAMSGSLLAAARRLAHRRSSPLEGRRVVPVVLATVRGVRMGKAANLVIVAAAIDVQGPAIVVVGSREVMFEKADAGGDDEYFGPEAEAPRESSFRAMLRPVRRSLFDNAPHLHLWAAPIDVVLRSGADHPFAFAFGPADFDMRSALDDLRREVPASFDDRTLKALLGTFGSAEASAPTIALAIELTGRVPSTAADMAVRLAASLRTHVSKPRFTRADVEFDIGLLNADCDVARLLSRAAHLGKSGSGARILLHGIPGGGKSILAAGIAEAMGRRVRSVRGGDVFFSKWGATERAIWSVLEDARRKGELVVLEEAESIVGNRYDRGSDTNRHLTTTATNEWLAALDEHYDPILATTNFPDDIDPAVRRRFHILIELLPFRPDQELYAWRRILRVDPPAGWIHRGETVVADFTTAATRMRLFGEGGAVAAAVALSAAIAARTGLAVKPMRIGFPITRDSCLDDLPFPDTRDGAVDLSGNTR